MVWCGRHDFGVHCRGRFAQFVVAPNNGYVRLQNVRDPAATWPSEVRCAMTFTLRVVLIWAEHRRLHHVWRGHATLRAVCGDHSPWHCDCACCPRARCVLCPCCARVVAVVVRRGSVLLAGGLCFAPDGQPLSAWTVRVRALCVVAHALSLCCLCRPWRARTRSSRWCMCERLPSACWGKERVLRSDVIEHGRTPFTRGGGRRAGPGAHERW